MNADLHTGFRHATPLRRFCDAQSIELYGCDGALHVRRQLLEQSPDVKAALGADVIVMRRDVVGLVDRYVGARGLCSAQEIDQFVARDRVHPGCQWLCRIVGVPLEVNCQHGLLHQVLRLRRAAAGPGKLALVIGAQMPTQALQQRPVGAASPSWLASISSLSSFSVVDMQRLYLLVRLRGQFGYTLIGQARIFSMSPWSAPAEGRQN